MKASITYLTLSLLSLTLTGNLQAQRDLPPLVEEEEEKKKKDEKDSSKDEKEEEKDDEEKEEKKEKDQSASAIFADDLDKLHVSSSPLPLTQIKGLLVMELSNGKHVGSVSQMNTTLMIDPKKQLKMQFNQKVGKMMSGSVAEVLKFTGLRYNVAERSTLLEFSFANKHNPKDGPSAAVALALMSDSIFSGKAIDQGFAVTGDMTAAGEVQPVGAVPSKLLAAISNKCTHVGIPATNSNDIADYVILNGPSILFQTQIIALEKFEQAEAVCYEEKSENITEAMEEFKLVMTALSKNPKYIYNSQVKEKLMTVVDNMPNHLSASILLKYSIKRASNRLSLAGSFNALDQVTSEIFLMNKERVYDKIALRKHQDDVNRFKKIIDPTFAPYQKELNKLVKNAIDYSYIRSRGSSSLTKAQRQAKKDIDADMRKNKRTIKDIRDGLLQDTEVMSKIIQ